jgi:hypothetical protein
LENIHSGGEVGLFSASFASDKRNNGYDNDNSVLLEYTLHLNPYAFSSSNSSYKNVDHEHNKIHQLWLMIISLLRYFLNSFPTDLEFYLTGEADSNDVFMKFHSINSSLTSQMNAFFTKCLPLLLPPLLRCTSAHQSRELSLLPLLETNIVTALISSYFLTFRRLYSKYKFRLVDKNDLEKLHPLFTSSPLYLCTFPSPLSFREKSSTSAMNSQQMVDGNVRMGGDSIVAENTY